VNPGIVVPGTVVVPGTGSCDDVTGTVVVGVPGVVSVGAVTTGVTEAGAWVGVEAGVGAAVEGALAVGVAGERGVWPLAWPGGVPP
jgi:hypothetical protein